MTCQHERLLRQLVPAAQLLHDFLQRWLLIRCQLPGDVQLHDRCRVDVGRRHGGREEGRGRVAGCRGSASDFVGCDRAQACAKQRVWSILQKRVWSTLVMVNLFRLLQAQCMRLQEAATATLADLPAAPCLSVFILLLQVALALTA